MWPFGLVTMAEPFRFRRINPAASLKRVLTRRTGRATVGFPPDKSGGLIEAKDDPLKQREGFLGFPPDKSGGLIEAPMCTADDAPISDVSAG